MALCSTYSRGFQLMECARNNVTNTQNWWGSRVQKVPKCGWVPWGGFRECSWRCSLGNEKSARSFSSRSFLHPPGIVDVRGCLHPNAWFSKVLRACPEFLTRDVGRNDPGTSMGYPARKLFSRERSQKFKVFWNFECENCDGCLMEICLSNFFEGKLGLNLSPKTSPYSSQQA